MFYIIMDLEWNNVYNRRLKGFINEIIEIGAVMIDSNLEIIDTFSVLIKSQLSKKLTSRVKELTHISYEDLLNGISFPKAIRQLTRWIGERECVIMTWGNTDVRAIIENYKFFMGTDRAAFMTSYVDLQKYCQKMLKIASTNQIGLSAAAEQFGIDFSEFSVHRALDDSLLAYRCLKKCYDKNSMAEHIMPCNEDFYRRLQFKVQAITNINNPKVDKSLMKCNCIECGNNMQRINEWKTVNQSFRAIFYCKNCDLYMSSSIKFKEYFDRVEVKASYKRIEKVPEGKTNEEEA